MQRLRPCSPGFTLPELLVALCLTLIIVGAGLALLVGQITAAQAAPAAVDRQERGRTAMASLGAALMAMGAGLEDGPYAGGLIRFIAPASPRRIGLSGSDPVTVARADAITLATIPWDAIWTTTATPVVGSTPSVGLEARPACAASGPGCGITAGTTVLIFDAMARHGVYRVTDVTGSTLALRGMQSSSPAFGPGAVIASVDIGTYYFDATAHQLRLYDGYLSDVAVVDDVVGMDLEYWGDPDPPSAPRPPIGEVNCLYDVVGHPVSGLGWLSTEGASLARLSLGELRDGPWCGEGDRQFDADLLRVRAIRLQVRVQTPDPQFRLSGPAFALPGSNTRAAAAIPDLTLVAEIAPRNLNLGR